MNRIEYESHLDLRRVSSDFSLIFCDFHTFFAHSINPKGLVVFSIFQGLIHIFKDILQISRTKGTFSNSMSFLGPWSNIRTFPGLPEP